MKQNMILDNLNDFLKKLNWSFFLFMIYYLIYVVYTTYLLEKPLDRDVTEVFLVFSPAFLFFYYIKTFNDKLSKCCQDENQNIKNIEKIEGLIEELKNFTKKFRYLTYFVFGLGTLAFIFILKNSYKVTHFFQVPDYPFYVLSFSFIIYKLVQSLNFLNRIELKLKEENKN